MMEMLKEDLKHFDKKWRAHITHNPDGLFSNPDESLKRARERNAIMDSAKRAMMSSKFGAKVNGFMEALDFYLGPVDHGFNVW